MAKEIMYEKGQSKLIEGLNKVADAVKVTLGPKGRCVAIQTGFGIPDITRDGATVAKSIELKDLTENLGAQLIKDAAKKTEELAGDGTSSITVLTQELVSKGLRYNTRNSNMNEVKSGMDKAVSWVTDYIREKSIPVEGDLEKIRRVATISANNDPSVGNLIVECMEKVGAEGVIVADKTSGLETMIEVVEGFKVERGWASPHFVTSPADGTCVMENPLICVSGEKISSVPQIIGVVEAAMKAGQPLLIICDDMDEVVMTTIVVNVLQGALRCCVVKGVDFGDSRKNIMADIAVAVGATYICPEMNLKTSEAKLESLGSANRVVVSKDSCVIYQGYGDAEEVKERLEVLKKRMEDPGISSYEKNKFEKRISCLSGGIGIIKAGGASDAEKDNRKATIEDAILASKSAIAEGVVCGGGYIFVKAHEEGKAYLEEHKNEFTEDEYVGAEVVFDSLPIIMKTIGENSGVQGDVLVERVKTHQDWGVGYNAKTGKISNLLEDGILDSAKVLRVSLENAVSTASLCLLTACTVVDEAKEEK